MRANASIRLRRARRAAAVKALGYANYDAYLRGPHWRRLRIRYQAADDLPQACICGETEVDLHHKTYERIGQERLTDLVPLCRRCHTLVHVLEARGDLKLDLSGFTDTDLALLNRAELQAVADQRENEDYLHELADRERLASLPFADRIAELRRRAAEQRVDISNDLRVIHRNIAKMQQRIEDSTRSSCIASIQRRVDAIEDKVVTPRHKRLKHSA